MKNLRTLFWAVSLLVLGGINSARSQTADEAADAIDLLRYQVTGKIDDDVTMTSHAFAQATDLNTALFWSDWLSPFLDIARQVLNGLTLVGGGGPTKHTSQVRQWLHTSIEGVDASQKAISIFGSVDRLKQDGENLALAIVGPAYTARIEAMLNRADDVTFAFEYEPYRQSVLNDLLGVSGNPSPLPVSRKSTNIDRKGGAIVPTVHEARMSAANQLSALSHQVRNSTLSPSQLQAILSFVDSRRQDVAQSRVGHRQVSYDALLSDGPTISPVPVAYSLGLIRALENWRLQMLTLFVEDTSVQMRVRTREVANQFVQLTADQLLQKGVKSLNLRLDVEAVVAGQGGANLIAADAASLGFGVALDEALDLADTDVVFASSSREQVTMLPQHMVDALPGEVSKVLMIVDDTVQYVNSLIVPRPTISGVSPRTFNTLPLPQTQLITITGTGFTSGSRLTFNDGVTTYADKVPTFISATELHYNITVGPNPATWTVKVVNGGTESLLYSFYVTSGTAQLTALAVSGPSAIPENGSGQFTATAQFSDGSSQTVTASTTWGENSSATTISSSGLLSAGSVGGNTAVTVSASYTAGGVTKTASANATVVNSANCGIQIQELIVNGNFANNANNWTLAGNFQADARFSACSSCPGYAYLANADGTAGNNLSGTLSQNITIPANATSATLGYYYRITTSDSTTVAKDFFFLNLVLPGGTLVGLDQKSNVDANSSYAYRSFDITAYKGQTITVRFLASTDGNGPTAFRVDDVSVIVSVPNPVTPVLFGVGGPTSVAEGSTAQYNAIVVNCDGSIQSVSPTWSENSSATTISSSGLLTAGSITSDRSATITATYGAFTLNYPITIVNSTSSFSYLAISGPSSINENSSRQFTATAIFSDGSSQSVSPSWSENSTTTSVSGSGQLMAGEVSGDTVVTVSASHTIGGVTCNANQDILIVNVPVPPTLVLLSISGPSSVNENSTAQYAATASFSDGSSQGVNPTWGEDSSATSISIFGLLSAGEVASDTPMTVSASYSFGGVTRNASKSVIVVNGVVTPTYTLSLSASNGTVAKNPDQATYTSGSQILLTATPTAGFQFAHWSGDASGNVNPLTVTMNASKSIAANFVTVQAMPHLGGFGVSNGVFRFVLRGPTGGSFIVQVSSNLVDWIPLGTFTIPVGGSLVLTDPLGGHGKRFYRALAHTEGPVVIQPGPADGKDIWTTSVYSYAPGGGGPGGGLNDENLRVGGWGDEYYALLQFDLTGLPTNADSAVLYLYCHNQAGGGTPMYLDRITQAWDWRTQGAGSDHERLWWIDRPSATAWRAEQVPNPTPGQWYAINITDLYLAWQNGTHPNYGLQLRPSDYFNNNFDEFYSADITSDPTLRPKLVITPTRAPVIFQPGPAESKDIWTTSVYSYAPGGGGPGGGLNDEMLRVGGWGDEYYSLLRFELAGLPTNAASAVLHLYCQNQSGGGTAMYLDRITDFWDWRTQGTGSDQERLWWTDRPSATPCFTGVLPNPTQGGWYTVNITDLYLAWQNGTYPNHGLNFRPVDFFNNNFNEFYSADYAADPAVRPKLVITPWLRRLRRPQLRQVTSRFRLSSAVLLILSGASCRVFTTASWRSF